MVYLTTHGALRAQTRLGLGPEEAQRLASEAYYSGEEYQDTKGPLRRWLERLKEYRRGSRLRVYEGFLFVFDQDRLVTCYAIPKHLLEEQKPPEPYVRRRSPPEE